MNKKNWFELALAATAVTTITVAATAYLTRRHWLGRAIHLPPPSHTRIQIQQNVRIPMPDGITLAADIYQPKTDGRYPTVLIRSPYGRGQSNLISRFYSQRFAEQGYIVVSQDTRGRGDSEGDFEPYFYEASDGAATIEWIVQQPWSDGQVATWGQSYLGFVQWAAASSGSPHLKALMPIITRSQLGGPTLPHEPFPLDLVLRWMLILDTLDNPELNTWQAFSRSYLAATQNELLQPGFNHLPLRDIDTAVFQRPIPYFREWLNHQDPSDPYWENSDYRATVPHVNAPVHLVAGWYDLFLTGQLDDYTALVEAGKQPYLTIGPWTHLAFANNFHALTEGIAWFDAHLKGKTEALRPEPVKLYLMGADEWRTYESWPPPCRHIPYYLQDNGRLATHPPTDSHPSTYTFNPADPTPNLGGPLLSSEAGPVDNRSLESRADVLTFTTDPCTTPLDIIGPVRVVLFARTCAPSADYFARLCVVLPNGHSINLCDGIVRATPTRTDSLLRMEIEMSATAYQFQPGSSLRLQISSGAHPRYARNLGHPKPDADATTMVTAHQTIYHDPQRPSALILPITTPTTS